MSISLSTCYNNLGQGRWEELCHEVMSSVLPMNDPGMSGDDLSSPTWRIIFLKDDCFLQPSCDMTAPVSTTTTSSSCTDPLAPYIHRRNSSIDTIDDDDNDNDDDPTHLSCATPSLYSLPSSIEPLFDGIDLNNQQQRHAYDQIPPSPSLSRSSSSPSLSDAEEELKPQPPRSIHLTVQHKRKPHTKKTQSMHHPSPRQNPHHTLYNQQQKRRRKHGSTRPPLATATPETSDSGLTLFEQLSMTGIDWCRYCGTTEGVNWRPGPWGKRTLCNKHGCDYKGYGLASRLPRLDLSGYRNELLQDRQRPVIQEFCSICQERGGPPRKSTHENDLVTCDGGCSRAFHPHCFVIDNEPGSHWYCSSSCLENRKKLRVVVDLPRKQPLMRPLKREDK